MKLKINKNLLLENLNFVSKGLSSRNIIPVLNGIKFELKEEGLYLITTDNEITIQTFIDKKDIKNIKETGTLIIYGKYIIEILRKLDCEDIEIDERDDNKVIVFTENSKFNLNCFNNNDFPNVTFTNVDKPLIINTAIFNEIINQTIFACSTQESRPLLTGINIKIIGDLLECTATDSYRLAKRTYKLNEIYDENINIVVPSRNISELVKLLTDDEASVEIHIFNNKIIFRYKNIIYQSSLLNGTYPSTDNSISNAFEYEIDVNLKTFYNSVDRASLLTSTKEKNILEMLIKDNLITILSNSQEIGKVEEKLECNKIKGENLKISFSSKYMLEAIKSFKGENLKLLFNGEIKPIILKSDENIDLIQLVLPIKTF